MFWRLGGSLAHMLLAICYSGTHEYAVAALDINTTRRFSYGCYLFVWCCYPSRADGSLEEDRVEYDYFRLISRQVVLYL